MKYTTTLLLLLFIGCRAPLKVADSQALKVTDKTQVATSEKKESKTEAEVSTAKLTDEAECVVTTTKVTEYDTDKPVNPDTGKPPVKSETETVQAASRGKKEQEVTQSSAVDTASYTATDSSRKDVGIEVQHQHSEKRQLPAIFWWAVSIVAVGVLALIFWRKIGGGIGKAIGWLKGLLVK
jgi:cobalamin biosynthesis Mg chelatase CobN